jgi:DNA-directed RNA polymerase subunit RPC12/RpoP
MSDNIKNPDDVIGVCSECKSDQSMNYMYKNLFAQQGLVVPCKYCGGVVVITYRETRDRSLDSSDKDRGIS